MTGDDLQTQVIINCTALPCLLNLLQTSHKKSIKKEACWTISNITAGTTEQIQVGIISLVYVSGMARGLFIGAVIRCLSLFRTAVIVVAIVCWVEADLDGQRQSEILSYAYDKTLLNFRQEHLCFLSYKLLLSLCESGSGVEITFFHEASCAPGIITSHCKHAESNLLRPCRGSLWLSHAA